MNGFKVFAVGAFLYCGPSFCHAQISILEYKTYPMPTLAKSTQGEGFQHPAAAGLTRSRSFEAEIATNPIENIFTGANDSPSDFLANPDVEPAEASDPASLPVGIRHRHSPIDQILRNGLISQTPNSAQVQIAWPTQGTDNLTARMLLSPGCTQGLWDNYSAERAAQCALMHQHLAGNLHRKACTTGCKPCGQAGCASTSECGTARSHTANRYAPPGCDCPSFTPASHAGAQPQPQYQSLLSPNRTSAAPFADSSENEVAENRDNVAQIPALLR